MELCAAKTVSKFRHRCFSPTSIRFQPLLRRQAYFPVPHSQTVSGFGLQYRRNSSLRSTTSEDISTDKTGYSEDDEPKTVDDTQLFENKEDDETQPNMELQDGSLFENPLKLFESLGDFNIKLEYEEIYPYLAFGSGGAVALWVVVAIVDAIDSIPVLPKALELVGLGYTLWFSSRYLILKKNREELFARVEHLKQQVLGSKDDQY